MWRIINSWWILLTLPMGLLSWAAFVYIGFKAKQKKWIIWGFVYSFALVGMFVGSDPSLEYFILVPESSWVMTLIDSIIPILWIASIIHAFYVRGEYLVRLETLKKYKCSNEDILRNEIENEFKQNNISNRRPIQKSNDITHSNPKSNAPQTETKKIVDINNDSEQTISELPGIGIILAKKAIEIRETRDFESVDDFGQALDLKPHIIEHIRPLIIINTSHKVFEPETSGRRVDF